MQSFWYVNAFLLKTTSGADNTRRAPKSLLALGALLPANLKNLCHHPISYPKCRYSSPLDGTGQRLLRSWQDWITHTILGSLDSTASKSPKGGHFATAYSQKILNHQIVVTNGINSCWIVVTPPLTRQLRFATSPPASPWPSSAGQSAHPSTPNHPGPSDPTSSLYLSSCLDNRCSSGMSKYPRPQPAIPGNGKKVRCIHRKEPAGSPQLHSAAKLVKKTSTHGN